MYQVITIGSALVDIFIHSQHFQAQETVKGRLLCQNYGDKVDVESLRVQSGGGGSNAAVAFSRLGLRAAVICETGRDAFQQIVLNELINEGVETSFAIREKKEQTGGSVILVGEDGGRTILVHRGASSQLDSYDISTYWLSQAGWVHLSSIAGQEETLRKIFKILSKEKEIALSWNPGKAELKLLREQQIRIDQIPCKVFFINKEEWQILEPVQPELLARINQIVVTDSIRGGDVYVGGKHFLHYQATKVHSTDNTGAGDAFASAYTAAQILGRTPRESVSWGVANASSVVKYYGAKTGLLYREQIERQLQEA